MSVPVVCFFELDGTDYGKRFGIMGKMVGNMVKGVASVPGIFTAMSDALNGRL
jgi:hypothetical protein